MRKEWVERREGQDIQWMGVQKSLMDVISPPNGRNRVISFGMKGMSWEEVESCRGVPGIEESVKLKVFSKYDTGYCKYLESILLTVSR